MKSRTMFNSKKLTVGLLIIYLAVLTWIIVFKMEFDLSLLSRMNLRSINLIPFAESASLNGRDDTSEILLNMVVFIPFGVYLSIIKPKWNFIQKVLPIFSVTLLYEVVQYIFAIGASDITDLLGNTLGGVIGIALFVLFAKILDKNTVKILNILATIGTTLVVIFLGLMSIGSM